MSDIVEKLRKLRTPYEHPSTVYKEAADEIERLREELQAEKGNTTFLAGQLGEQEDDKKALRKRIAELERGKEYAEMMIAKLGRANKRIAELEELAVLSGWQSLDGDLDGKYIITEAQIDAAEKHILTSSLEWIRAFAYGVLFELGLLDESGVSVLARSVDGESGLPNTAKVGRVQPDESEAASRHFITDAQLDAAWAKRVLIPSADNDDSANTYIPIKPLGIERCGGCEECEGDGWYWKEEK